MKRCLLGILVLMSILLGGCAQPQILEENGIMSVYGVDITQRDQLSTTSVYYKFGSKGQGSSRLVTGKGKTLAEGQKRMNYKLGFELQSGSIELELFGKKAAKKGLISYMEAAVRDPVASSRRLLAISDTTAEGLITKIDKRPNINVNRVLSKNIEVNNDMNVLPKVTLHSFDHHYYESGRDPVMPIMSYQDKKVKLTALGLFRGDQLAGKIPIDQAFYIKVAHETIHGLHQEVQLPLQPLKQHLQKEPKGDRDHLYTVFNIEKGTSKTKLVDKQNLHFQTQLKFGVNLLELTESINLQKRDAISALETEIEKTMKQQYTQLVTKLQELNVDPIGYGRIYKAQKRSGALTESEWRDKFPDITVDVDVDVTLLDQGITP
ncbi:hypothetical protein GCM10028778_20150 [Barrientosiimonas marina]|uniref:Ger(X)C family spore germination protein n=1 Tax=Lentibacillus kimchii TaxID=1542911 RepID=A0ABW2UUX9_9BACI